MGLTSALRRRLGHELRKSGAVRELRTTVEAQAARIDELTRTVGTLGERVRPMRQTLRIHDLDQGRFSSQLGALEERVGLLEQQAADTPLVSDDASAAEARGLIDEVRREHEQIRIRMQVITWYEERLRRVEESLAELYSGDRRHPV